MSFTIVLEGWAGPSSRGSWQARSEQRNEARDLWEALLIFAARGVQAVEHHRKRVRIFSTVELVNVLEQELCQFRNEVGIRNLLAN